MDSHLHTPTDLHALTNLHALTDLHGLTDPHTLTDLHALTAGTRKVSLDLNETQQGELQKY